MPRTAPPPSPPPAPPIATPRRGRPARFSREQIVDAVAEMLLADPTAPLTITRAADAVGAAPMSLYRHFTDRDDLVAAVAQKIFAGARPTVAPGTPWQDEVRAWMTTVFRQATRVPQLVQLVASGESPAWVPDSVYLAAALERAGVDDDELLAEAVYWVATTTLGHAMIHIARPLDRHMDVPTEALARLSDDDADRVRRLVPRFAALSEGPFDRVAEWTIAALEHQLTTRTA